MPFTREGEQIRLIEIVKLDGFALLLTGASNEIDRALQVAIPPRERKWDPKEKSWRISEKWVSTAIETLTWIGHRVSVLNLRSDSEKGHPVRDAAPAGDGRWAEALRDALPEELHKAVYAALLQVLHPDKGGDTALAQQLNQAFRP